MVCFTTIATPSQKHIPNQVMKENLNLENLASKKPPQLLLPSTTSIHTYIHTYLKIPVVADIENLVKKVIREGFGGKKKKKTRINEVIEIIINHIKEFEAKERHEKF